MNRGYVVKIYPNEAQKKYLEKQFGCVRWVYNKMIEINEKKYNRTGKSLSGYDMQNYLPKLKKQYPWLKEVSNQALQITCHNLGDAYKRFFKKQNKYPSFKKKGFPVSFSNIANSYIVGNKIRLQKLEPMRFRGNVPQGEIRKITISQIAGSYYASINIKMTDNTLVLQIASNILGIDLGLKDMLVTSTGRIVTMPKFTKVSEIELRVANKTVSRRKKGSQRIQNAKLALSKIHAKIRNQRKDFHHKISTNLVADSENQAFALENLNVKGMIRNRRLSKSIADAGWFQFKTFLKYKAEAVGKQVLEVGRFYPSSKTCSACGVVNESLTLADRAWDCLDCGVKHHRDINAARNIALEAARNSARGDDVRLETLVRAIVGEARSPVMGYSGLEGLCPLSAITFCNELGER